MTRRPLVTLPALFVVALPALFAVTLAAVFVVACGDAKSPSPAPATAAPPTPAASPAGAAPTSGAAEPNGKLKAERAKRAAAAKTHARKRRDNFADGRLKELKIGARLARMRSLERGRTVDLVSVRADGQVYRVVLTESASAPWTDIVTADGEHIFVDPVDFDRDLALAENQLKFANCLKAAKLVVYVRPRGKEAGRQLKQIGPWAGLVAVTCPKGKDDPVCIKAGIAALPTVVVAKTQYPGFQGRAWLEAATGCK